MKIGESYIWIGSFIGIFLLIIFQYILFKKDDNSIYHKFIFSKSLVEVLKELLVVVLGVTLAIAFTDMVEVDHTKETAYRLLEIYDYRIEYRRNSISGYIQSYENGEMGMDEIYDNLENGSSIFAQLIAYDEIIKTMHPNIYILIESANFEMDSWVDGFRKDYNNNRATIYKLKNVVWVYDNVVWLMGMEKEHLDGKYTDDEVKQFVVDHITNRQDNKNEDIQNYY